MRRYGPYSFEGANEDKPLFPASGIRKGDLIDYYERAASAMLPYLRDRPLMMHRFPDDIGRAGFYQKQIDDYFPDWVRSVSVEKEQGGRQRLVVCDNEATLAYLANQACITPHLWLSRAGPLDYPDQCIIDLDPPSAADFGSVRQAAFQVRDMFEELGMAAFVKTTGSKGVHVSSPLDRSAPFDTVRALMQRIASVLETRYPAALTTEQRKRERNGRLFLDVGRNSYAQTAVAPYAIRAKPGAPVATPLAWEELKDDSIHAASFDMHSVIERLQQQGPWSRSGNRGFWQRARSVASIESALKALESA